MPKTTGGTLKFFYCEAGPTGEPILMIRPHLEEQELHTLKKQLRTATFTRGDVRSADGQLVFEVEPAFASRLTADLRRFFSKKVSALQSARVIARDVQVVEELVA